MNLATSYTLVLIHLVSICPQSDARSFEIWIFQNEMLTQTELTRYEDLDSKNIYVVRAREKNTRRRLPETFCWVGAESSQDDTAQAVISAFTEAQFSTIHLSKGIRQESQGRESRYFIEIFEPTTADKLFAPKNSHFWPWDTRKPWLAETRMILVKHRNDRHFVVRSSEEDSEPPSEIVALEEVEFSSTYLKEDVCFITFNSKMVYLHCPNKKKPTENEKFLLRNSARFVANEILKEKSPGAGVFNTVKDSSQVSWDKKIKQLTQELENISKAKLEREKDEDQSLESGPIKLTVRRILKDSSRLLMNHDFSSSLWFFLHFQHHECYVIDPGSEVFSTLVWIGKDTDSDVRKECIEDVNLRAKERSSIIYIDENYTTLARKWLQFSPAEFIRTMNRVYESWTDIFHSMHEGPGSRKF